MNAAKNKLSRDDEFKLLELTLKETRETLMAIRSGEVDALVVATPNGDQVFTLTGADRPYRLFVEAMAEGSLVLSDDGTILSCNSRMARLAEASQEELIGSNISTIFRGDIVPTLVPTRTDDEMISPIDLNLKRATGGSLPVSVTTSKLDLDGLRVTCMLVTDESERRRSQEAQSFQARLLDAAGESIVVTDAEGVVVYVNRAAQNLYGLAAQDFLGRLATQIISWDLSADQTQEIINQLRAGSAWSGEITVKRRDGTEFPIFIHKTPVLDDYGTLQTIIDISIDITKKKKAESDLASREKWFRTLVSSSSDSTVVVNSKGTIGFANLTANELVGFDLQAATIHNPLTLVHPADRGDLLGCFSTLKTSPRARKTAIFRIKDIHGNWRFIDARFHNCLDDPAINGIVINARDVSEQRRLARALDVVSRVNEIIVHATEETALLEAACTAIAEFGDYILAWVGRANRELDALVQPIAAAGILPVLNEIHISAANNSLGQGVTGLALRKGSPQITNSFSGRRFKPWSSVMAKYGIASGCSFPLMMQNEIWALTIYSAEKNAFDEATISIFQQLVDDLVFGIERIRDSERLKTSEATLRDAERLAHLGRWEWETETDKFEFLAEEVFAIHGVTPGNWGGTYQSFLNLVYPGDRDTFEAAIAATKETGMAKLQHRITLPSGEIRHIMLHAELLPAAGSQGKRIAGTCIDISDLVVANAAREKSNQFLLAITDNMVEGMIALDREGTITFANQASCRMLGWKRGELIGLPEHETFHAAKADGSPNPIESCTLAPAYQNEQVVRIAEDTFVRRDLTLLPVSINASPLKSETHAGEMVLVFEDITDRIAERARIKRDLDKLAWVGRVRDALEQNRFVLYAQPIVDIQTGDTVQNELLIRMIGVDGSIIPPGDFLPAAEEFGLIGEIDRWVIKETARIAGHGIQVEFNLSAKSVMDPNIVHFIMDSLTEANAAPELVICEITETSLMSNYASGETLVRELTQFGCHIALDDFGTGYGGFTYLKRMPVAALKIDSEFIRDVTSNDSSRNVVAAVVSLARAFSAKTVAEGAEDLESVEVLRSLGVDLVQGYVFGHPLPLQEAFGLKLYS